MLKNIKYYLLISYLLIFVHNDNIFAVGQCENDFICNLFLHLVGSTPNKEEYEYLTTILNQNKKDGDLIVSQEIIKNHKEFKSLLLKNFASTWSEIDGKKVTTLNDTILTIIAVIDMNIDYRKILFENIIAKGVSLPSKKTTKSDEIELPNGDIIKAYFYASNEHYNDLQKKERYTFSENIFLDKQVPGTHKVNSAVAGILSTNGFAKEAYLAGTNRRALKILIREASCLSLDDIRDAKMTEAYISRDVDRFDSNGSDHTFKSTCKTCHAFLDQLYGAFAYYDVAAGGIYPSLIYKFEETLNLRHKMLKNVVYPKGYLKKNNQWFINLTPSQLNILGFPNEPKSGFGAKSLGELWSKSDSFARCQPKKVFETVCRKKVTDSDQPFINSLVSIFKENNYMLKDLFLRSAIYCAKEK